MMNTLVLLAAVLSALVWMGLLLFRGGFWRADQRLREPAGEEQASWPRVCAVIPARNEAGTVGETVRSLLAQTYPGRLDVVVVDDNSDDGTGDVVRAAGAETDRVHVVTGRPLEAGWTGKLWAVSQGIACAREIAPDADYLLLTDADIAHHGGNLSRLVAKAETQNLDLVSLMVRLRCSSFWERLLIPAFVFFFQKLYPFPWVNDPARKMAGAAGGCMLVRRGALEAAGGIEAIKGRVIDDCALAALLKARGAIWLGLASRTASLRPYEGLGEIWRMVARTAFVQLNHSVLYLLGTLLGMVIMYLMPLVAMVYGGILEDTAIVSFGAVAYGLMAVAFAPTLRLYGLPGPWLLTLPVAGVLYTLMTLDSARRHWQGQGGAWKGRTYGAPPEHTPSDGG